ncbi:hypothetical protein [Streptomyces sp. NPDC003015]
MPCHPGAAEAVFGHSCAGCARYSSHGDAADAGTARKERHQQPVQGLRGVLRRDARLRGVRPSVRADAFRYDASPPVTA